MKLKVGYGTFPVEGRVFVGYWTYDDDVAGPDFIETRDLENAKDGAELLQSLLGKDEVEIVGPLHESHTI